MALGLTNFMSSSASAGRCALSASAPRVGSCLTITISSEIRVTYSAATQARGRAHLPERK